MKNWEIRQALAGDASNLAACMQAAYSPYQERLDGIALPPLLADYEIEIRDYPCWVAQLDEGAGENNAGTVNGGIIAGLIMDFDDVATISNVAVHPLAQGLGLGKGLLEFAESEAKKRGFNVIRLATHVLLSENIAFYEYLGWRVTGRDSDRVYFEKSIS